MFLKVSFQSLKDRYPALVEDVLRQIRRSRSKHRNSPPSTFRWGFNWSVQIPLTKPTSKTLEESLQDYASRCQVFLEASWGRGQWFSRIEEVPEEILNLQRRVLESQQETPSSPVLQILEQGAAVVDPVLVFPNTKFVPCSGGCGWDLPLEASDPRTTVLCHDCDPKTRGKPLLKCDCDGCNYGPTHTGVWASRVLH